MAKRNRPTHVSRPTFPGGKEGMQLFVREHLKYPEPARANSIEGTVVVRYSLDYTGKVVRTRVKKGIGHGCDEEAERVVRLMRFKVPQDRKRKVRIHQDVNIHFKLPKAPPARQRVVYTRSASTKKEGGSYSYTINW